MLNTVSRWKIQNKKQFETKNNKKINKEDKT